MALPIQQIEIDDCPIKTKSFCSFVLLFIILQQIPDNLKEFDIPYEELEVYL